MEKIRKKLGILCLIFCTVFFCFGMFAACNSNDDEITYTVNVCLPDGSAAADTIVTLSKDGEAYGSATVSASGKITLTLTADVYDVGLSNLPEGYVYANAVKTNRLGTEITITLQREVIRYSVTVLLPDDSPAAGVTVVWSDKTSQVASSATNTDGTATADVASGTYTVTVEDAPEGYYLSEGVSTDKNHADVTVRLEIDNRVEYSVSVRSTGGVQIPDVGVYVFLDSTFIESAVTDENGIATFRLDADAYYIYLRDVPVGYAYDMRPVLTDTEGNPIAFELASSVIDGTAPSSTKYVLGSIMYDFTVTTADGSQTLTLSELLKTKKAVVLNFWYTTCSWCIEEFPYMQSAYDQYSDDLELIALDPFDSLRDIVGFAINYGLTVPMASESTLYQMFSVSGYPTTVVIDRYGAVAFIMPGAISETNWLYLMAQFTADDYVQSFTPGKAETEEEQEVERVLPNVDMPASSEIEAAINNTASGFTFSYYPETQTEDAQYSWPWIVSSYDGKQVIKPSNSGYANSFATIHTYVDLKANEAIAFDFFSSTENGADIVYVLVDGVIIWQITGSGTAWSTCYAYVALEEKTYDLALLYVKDYSGDEGDDAVYITNMRICSADEIGTSTDFLRPCATDINADFTAYEHYVDVVFNETDGYWHVGTENGPLVLVNLMSSSGWSNIFLYYYVAYAEDFGLTLTYDLDGDGVKENCYDLFENYASLAVKSDYYGLVPVNIQLYKLLNCFVQEFAELEGRTSYEKEWLELCYYFTRYGGEGEAPNPILGLAPDTAFLAAINYADTETKTANTFSLNKIILPVGYMFYKVTPSVSGVYHFYSVGDESTQAWLFDETGSGLLDRNGDDNYDRLQGDLDNFTFYHYLQAEKTYYLSCAFYWSGMTGSFDFYVDYMGETYTVLTKAASGYCTTTLDEYGNMTDEIYRPAVEVKLGDDGKYHAVNEDGSLGSVILVDFTQPTQLYSQSLTQIINAWIYDWNGTIFKQPFDFSKSISYARDVNGDYLLDESGKYIVTITNTDGVDYTNRMLEIAATADENGFVEATQELVDILTLFAQEDLFGLENDWLVFAYYYHLYGPSAT